MSGYELFVSQVDQACNQFTKLSKAVGEDGKTILKGELDVVDKDGKFWESYQVEIHSNDKFPYRFPIVYETGGKIPCIGDWHINEDSKSCCITVLPEEILICKNGITLSNFIKNEVVPYFFNQTHRRVEGYYKNGEYAHGLAGIFQFYDEVLKSNFDVRKAIQLMLFIAKRIKPGRTHDCFCGSGEKFRKCHREAFEKLVGIEKDILKDHARQFASATKLFDLVPVIAGI